MRTFVRNELNQSNFKTSIIADEKTKVINKFGPYFSSINLDILNYL